MAKRGRPSVYTEKLADEICERLMCGESMRQICEDEKMPNRTTVVRWMGKDSNFAAKCARARDLQADLMDDKILELAENCTPKSAPADRVKLAAYQWRASKLAPKKYGDRMALEHSGGIELTNEQLESRLSQLLRKAGIGDAAGGTGETEVPK